MTSKEEPSAASSDVAATDGGADLLSGIFDALTLGSAVLRLPVEVWLQVFSERSLDVIDLTRFRAACRSFWRIAPTLMPTVVARCLPEHASDPWINEELYAEACYAAHKLNVRHPFAILISRDDTVKWDYYRMPPSAGAPGPSRKQWSIGSRRTLHEAFSHYRRVWMFGACDQCRLATCKGCHRLSTAVHSVSKLQPPWYISQKQCDQQAKGYSAAIYAADAIFCGTCTLIGKDEAHRVPADATQAAEAETQGFISTLVEDKDRMRELQRQHKKELSKIKRPQQKQGLGIPCWACSNGGHKRTACLLGHPDTAPPTQAVPPVPSAPIYRREYSSVQLECLDREKQIRKQLRADEEKVQAWRAQQTKTVD